MTAIMKACNTIALGKKNTLEEKGHSITHT